MCVCHVNSGNLYGGIETLFATLARQREACRDMKPVFVLCFGGRLADELRATGADVEMIGPVRLSRPWTIWGARRRLGRFLRSQSCDVVVSHGCWNHVIAAPVARRAGLPCVFWAHDIQAGNHWLERWAGRHRPDVILANSRTTAQSVHTLFGSAPMEVVYLPVGAGEVPLTPETRAAMRLAIGTPADAIVILIACRFEPWKGHAVLIDGLARMRDCLTWECWIAGGPQRPAEHDLFTHLRQRATARGIANRVRFLGQRSDVCRLMAAADIYCQPNTGPEPFGIVFIEALHAGLPVVTSNFGGGAEIVDDTCGVLVPPGDVQALGAALRRLIDDQVCRRNLGSTGPQRALSLCEPTRQINRIAQLLHGVAHA
jgi:glycosyltransferase involved in cell wall biosynthesis